VSASSESGRLKVAVLLSGRGSNLAALIGAAARDLPIEIVGVFADRADAQGLQRAMQAGIYARSFSPKDYADKATFEAALFAAVAISGAELVILAGFMRVLSAATVEAWRGRLINIHPSLLPNYPGLHTHQRALDAGDAQHGASVHFVTAVLDSGPVLMQVQVAIQSDDSAESLSAHLLPEEHRLMVASVRLFADRRVRLLDNEIELDGQILREPLILGP